MAIVISLFGIARTLALWIRDRAQELGRGRSDVAAPGADDDRYGAVITALIGASSGSSSGTSSRP